MVKKQLIRLTESDLHRIVENVINEGVWGDIKRGFKDMGGWNGLLKAAYPGLSNMQRQGNENPNVENDVKVVYKRLNKRYKKLYDDQKAKYLKKQEKEIADKEREYGKQYGEIQQFQKVKNLDDFNPNTEDVNAKLAKEKLLITIKIKYELAFDVAELCYKFYAFFKGKLDKSGQQGWKIYMDFWYEKYQINFEDSERQKTSYYYAKNGRRFDTNTQGTPSNSNTQQQQAQQQAQQQNTQQQ